MSDPVTMAMVGAAIGGGGSLLSGKSLGTSLKNAALGGTLGYGGGTLFGAGAGGIGGAAGSTGTGLSQGAGGLLGATGSAAGGTASLAPTVVGGSSALTANTIVPEALAGTIESSGMVFNPATGSYLAPEAYIGASSATPIYTGTGSLLDKFTMGAQSLGSDLSARLPDAMSIDNLRGAQMVANQFQSQPMQMGGGSIKVGQAPTGDIYDALRKVGYTLPQRRQTNFA